MTEVAHSCKYHRHTEFVGCVHHFLVADGSAWLNNCSGPGLTYNLEAVSKGEERVRRSHAWRERQGRFHGAEPGRIHAAHLARAHPERLAVAGVDDSIGLHVL